MPKGDLKKINSDLVSYLENSLFKCDFDFSELEQVIEKPTVYQ
jgi:hypothetical protein